MTRCFRSEGFPRAGRKNSGSVIVYALIVMAVGGVLLAGLVQLLATQALYPEQLSENVKRRVVLENSRLLASQYLLQNILPGNYSGTASLAMADGWAEFTLTGTATGAPLTVVDPPDRRNLFSPGGHDGFGLNILATLSDGETAVPWEFELRSINPIFGHDLFTSQKPTLAPGTQIIVQAGLRVADNVVVWVPNSPNGFSFGSGSYQTPTVSLPTMTPPLNGAGEAVLMSNFAFAPVSSGTAGGGLGYDGSLAVIDPGGGGLLSKAAGASGSPIEVYSGTDADVDLSQDPPASAPYPGGVSSDGAGTVTIDLSESSSQLIYITNDVSTLVLQGELLASADYYASPTDDKAEGVENDPRAGLLIVYVQNGATVRDLASIQLVGQNNRRVYLAIQKQSPTALTFATASAGRWRLAAVLENTPMGWALGGNLQVVGGLRTDASVGISGGTLDVYRETDPRLLSRHADRMVWLEGFRQ